VGNAQLLRRLETVEKALSHNAKIVVPTGSDLVNVIGELAGLLPIPRRGEGGGGVDNPPPPRPGGFQAGR